MERSFEGENEALREKNQAKPGTPGNSGQSPRPAPVRTVRNYQKELERILSRLESRQEEKPGEAPEKLLLHGCCAPCSSYVLEYLSRYFSITLWFYNPNISSKEEYEKRAEELKRLVKSLPVKYPVSVEIPPWDPEPFFRAARGLEQEPEGGARCRECFALRLEQAAALASSRGFPWYCTTLSISPLKNAPLLNALGEEMGKRYGVSYLPSDFKKKEGYKRSLELSREYGLYRQDYCGCAFSRQERLQKKQEVCVGEGTAVSLEKSAAGKASERE